MPDSPRAVRVTVDGAAVDAVEGQSIASALWAAGIRGVRRTRFADRPRGMYCGIGQCFDCLVSVDGGRPLRACVTPVADGQRIGTV